MGQNKGQNIASRARGCETASMHLRIGEMLVEAGVLTAVQLDQVLNREAVEGEERVASELYALGLVHERALCEALTRRHGHPALVLSESALDLSALGLVPQVIAERHSLLAVAIDEETLTLVVPDVEMGPILEQVQFASGRSVVAVIGVKKIIVDALGPAYTAAHRGDKVLAGQKSGGRTDPYLALVRDVPADSEQAQVALSEGLIESSAQADALDQLAPAFVTPPIEDLEPMPVSPGTPAPDPISPPEDPGDAAHQAVPIGMVDLVQVPVMRPAQVPAPIASAGTPVDIVMAEDDESIANLVKAALEHDGYSVRCAATGDEAVQLLRQYRPRLILLDAMLPGVHGFEICARIKRSEIYRGVPVVMISAVYKGWEQARDIQEVHGADAFIEKPFDVHFLRKVAAGYLGGELARAPLQQDTAAQIQTCRATVHATFLLGDWLAALNAARRWISLDPFDGHAYLELGNIAAQRSDLPAALKAYEIAVVYIPKVFVARTNLAMIYERLGFRRRAIESWKAAMELAPDAESMVRVEERITVLNQPS